MLKNRKLLVAGKNNECMKIKNALIVHKFGYSTEEKKTLEAVKNILKKRKILYRCISPLELHHEIVKERDCIFVVGGDGTFLKTAQYVHTSVPFLCIIGDQDKTEGFFSSTTRQTAAKKIDALFLDKLKRRRILRLVASINGKNVDPCMNEYYIGQQKPYAVARYLLQVGKKKEEQKSSGILVGTPAGSTAWSRGAGGKILSHQKKVFQFIVREPYIGRHTKTTLHHGILDRNGEILIIAKTEGMILVADGVGKEYPLKKDDKVKIAISKNDLLLYF